MSEPHNDDAHPVTDAFRVYRYTAIYLCIAITVVLALLIYDLANGPIPTPCH